MSNTPTKVATRIKDAIKRFQPLIEQAKARDIGEADTSTLVKDVLAEVFGYDKYTEITAEYQIKGTYCDLAIKMDGKIVLLIEVKAVNLELKESQIKQAVDYAANQGVEWVVLTNAQTWNLYKISFGQPISNELLMSINMSALNHKNEEDIDSLYLLSREAQGKSLLEEYLEQRQALSRFSIGVIILSEPVLSVIRRELKKISPDVRIDIEEIAAVLSHEVIKREILEGEKAVEAKKKLTKAINKALKAKIERSSPSEAATVTETNQVEQT